MKKKHVLSIVFLIFLTTYTPNNSPINNFKLNIKKIEVENIKAFQKNEILEKLSYLYNENLFILDTKKIEEKLSSENYIETFVIKKIFPDIIKIIITEKKPIAIIQIKKEKFYISNKGSLFDYKDLNEYNNLPVVFGKGKNFFKLYTSLLEMKFPIEKIKTFYFFEAGRWDLIMTDGKVIKLPISDYIFSLESFMKSSINSNFDKYRIFDYRIKDQLILN